jgi:hypothetical protein
MLSIITRRTTLISKNKVSAFHPLSNSFSSDSDKKNGFRLSDITQISRTKVIYGMAGLSTFYFITKGIYVITYDLLALSPASMLRYGFYGGMASSNYIIVYALYLQN